MKTFSQYLVENSRATITTMQTIVQYLITDGMKNQATFVGGVMSLAQYLQKLSGLPNPKLKRMVRELQQLASNWQGSQLQIRQTLQMIQIELEEYENDLFA